MIPLRWQPEMKRSAGAALLSHTKHARTSVEPSSGFQSLSQLSYAISESSYPPVSDIASCPWSQQAQPEPIWMQVQALQRQVSDLQKVLDQVLQILGRHGAPFSNLDCSYIS